MLKCGIYKKKITPAVGAEMPGYFHVRENTGALTELYAKAVVFEKDGTLAALCVLDAIFTNRNDVLSIRRKAQELCGIAPDNIFIWATHSHTAGPVCRLFRSKREKNYIRYMTEQAAQAIAEAYNSRTPCRVGSTRGRVEGIAFIRRFFMEDGGFMTNPPEKGRIKPENTPDETYTLMRIEDESGKIMGFISNFALHLDTVGGDKVSADYPDELARLVGEKFGTDVESVFLTGPCGDVNHINFDDRKSTNTTQRIAEVLFNGLCRLNEEIKTDGDLPLCVKTRRFLVPLREVEQKQVQWAQGVLEDSIPYEDAPMTDNKLRARAILEIEERIEDSIEVEIGALSLGNAVIIQWPCEIFTDFGRSLRRAYAEKDILVGELGGGTLSCYVPTEEAFAHGGYEPTAADAYCAKPDFGMRIVEETLKMMGQA